MELGCDNRCSTWVYLFVIIPQPTVRPAVVLQKWRAAADNMRWMAMKEGSTPPTPTFITNIG